MRNVFMVIVLTIILGVISLIANKNTTVSPKYSSPTPTITSTKPVAQLTTLLFVPYWTLQVPVETAYDHYVYFGIEANEQGINHRDDGYRNLSKFVANTQGKKQLLAIRMIDSRANARILENKTLQHDIAKDAAAISKQYGFDGVVLDFEISALSFDSVIKQITELVTVFAKTTKENKLHFGVALYGDTYYRLRPYDVKAIARQSDSIYIMAYDFHKSSENPGPTFPFVGKEHYGYDFKTMVRDFINDVPKEKLVVVIGMFGYDWEVDGKGQAVGAADPLSFYKGNQLFGSNCLLIECTVSRDTVSGGIRVKYKDTLGKQHVVWYEDLVSSQQKQEYLKKEGIPTVGFWAHSFF